MRHQYYKLVDKKPVKCDLHEWGKVMEKRNCHVGNFNSNDKVSWLPHVSTVFLGLDHQYGDGPPLLFETMIFGGWLDQHQWRYSTWEEAKKGHWQHLFLVLITLPISIFKKRDY